MKEQKTNDNSKTTTNNKQLEILKNNFANCFDKNGDFIPHKMQEIIAKNGLNLSKESYSLNWLGKSYARLLANETPLTLLKEDREYNQKPENQNSENLLIKGDNLEVLKHLRHAYSEQVKMIYIDPPYNTGGDGFVYQDDRKFTSEQLQQLAGIDEDEAQRILDFTASNSNSHSAWLTFMYPRLYIARELLSDDGVIFISIDDNEQAQLKMLCDEVFGEDNFVTEFVWEKKKKPAFLHKNVGKLFEYILCYTKNNQKTFPFSVEETQEGKKIPVNNAGNTRGILSFPKNSVNFSISNQIVKAQDMSDGNIITRLLKSVKIENGVNANELILEGEWRYSQQTIDEIVTNDDEFRISKIPFRINRIKKGQSTKKMKNAFSPVHYQMNTNEDATKYLSDLFNSDDIFSNPKPHQLIQILVKAISYQIKAGVILDFFAGSGTTADAVMQLNAEDGGNRKYISVQLPEPIDEKKNQTAYDFVKDELSIENPTIFNITKERIIRAAKKIEQDQKNNKDLFSKDKNLDLGFKIFETLPMFKGYFNEMDEESKQIEVFDGSSLSDDDLSILLSTWMLNDGIKLNGKVEQIILDKYTAYYADKKLYLMDKGFTTNDLKSLIEKLDSVEGNNKNFQPNKLVLFGYNFESKHQREISEALNNYTNKKQIELDRVVRY